MSARAGGVLIAGALLSACVSATATRPPPRVALDGDCATSLAQLPLNTPGLAANDANARPRQFADLARCLQDDAGRRPVARFDVSTAAPPYAIKIDLRAGQGGALAARVLVLDAERRVLRRHGFGEFIARGRDYSLTLFINAADGAARELLIEPDPEHVGRAQERVSGQTLVTPIISPVVVGSFVSGVERREIVALRDAGAVAVMLTPYTPETLEPKRR